MKANRAFSVRKRVVVGVVIEKYYSIEKHIFGDSDKNRKPLQTQCLQGLMRRSRDLNPGSV